MSAHVNPVDSLAFSMHTNRGVYALLLGSGVSRASKIPTGWEITIDLVRKVAAMQGASCGTDPAAWYEKVFGIQPDYSDLLDKLCRSPAERQQLVRSYLEPTDVEREEGSKQPTAAHRAIAELVKAGFIRVILTTNFDKLTELALQDVGVVPTVLSSADHIAGALPLVHTACTVIKIHGDYLDTRIRNTANELSSYPDEFNRLLDRVFDEYGLVVCGWSAEWDEALRNALLRAPYRRFSTYWASRGEPGCAAKDLIQRKSAHLVPIEGADSFFSRVCELVNALDAFSQPHPLSTDAAVISLKKYMSEPKYRIQLDDLIASEVERVALACDAPAFDTQRPPFESKALGDRVRGYEAASTTLIAMALVAGYWSKGDQITPWQRALARLSARKFDSGIVPWVELQRYPACLMIYAFGLGAIAGRNFAGLAVLLSSNITREYLDDLAIVVALNPVSMFGNGTEFMKQLPGKNSHFLPLNSWLEDFFATRVSPLIHHKIEYLRALDRLEMLWTLAYAHSIRAKSGHFWVPFGNFIYRGNAYSLMKAEIRSSLDLAGEDSEYVKSGIFGATVKECEELLDRVEPLAVEWARQRY